jgi:REP element-mobilizing transposase RayT
MNSRRYTEEFKIEAVKQVADCGCSASEMARQRESLVSEGHLCSDHLHILVGRPDISC